MKRQLRRKKYRRKKFKHLLFVLSVLVVFLIVLLRGEIIANISDGEVIQDIEQQPQYNQSVTENNEPEVELPKDRWNYSSKYEYTPPTVRNGIEVKSILANYAESYPEFQDVYNNISDFPEDMLAALCNNPDMLEFVKGYPSADTSVIGSISEEDTAERIPLLIQWDTRWGYYPYGDDNVALSGCAPTCLSMVIVGLTGNNNITPAVVAQYATDHDYYLKGTGTVWKIMTEGCVHFGVRGKMIALSRAKVFSELEKGHPIICSMGAGDFTTLGHFIVLAGIKDGKIIVNDPNSKVRSSRLWDYEVLEGQIKNLWAFS